MMETRASNRLRFTSTGRDFDREEEIEVMSVGVDIGSSTFHLMFSRLVLRKSGSRYVVSDRCIIHESEVLLTPYCDDLAIDAASLGTFIDRQYANVGLSPDEIDTGVLILTGVAARRNNSRRIGELFSGQAGKFVALSAGDALETQLAAHGSGAIERSIGNDGLRVMNVDVGGGTSKIAVCRNGKLVDYTVIEVGARLISLDSSRNVARLEEAGKFLAQCAGASLAPGDNLSDETARRIVRKMADKLFQSMGADLLEKESESLFRLPPLKERIPPDVISFSGGVSEYIYGRETGDYNDLGPLLAQEIKERLKTWKPKLQPPAENIRATALGASQYTIQVTGNTVFVSPTSVLPLRNVPVVDLNLPLDDENLDPGAIANLVSSAAGGQLPERDKPVAFYYHWDGAATYDRIDSFCEGILSGYSSSLELGLPLIIVTGGDVGGLIGMHLKEVCYLANPIVSIDGIELKPFDFVDVGAFLEKSGALPVVIKSLVFSARDTSS